MQFLSQSTKKYPPFSKRIFTWTTIFVLSLVIIFPYAKTVHAGLVSYINSFFGSEQASAKIVQNQSNRNSQTVALLQAATNFDPNPEKTSLVLPIIGDTLVADIVMSEIAVGPENVSNQISSYIVRDGDTLSGIAEMFQVSVNTILWANDISRNSALRPGQTLVILPVTGINYTVKKGDSIRKIVQNYKADLNEVLLYNDLSLDSKLVVGQTILIPDVEMQISAPSTNLAKGFVKNNKAHDTNGPDLGSYFMRPCAVNRCVKTQGLHGHNSIDLAGPVGTPLYASAAGTVIVSKTGGWNGGYGNYVIISHKNGTQTVYGHNSKNLVVVGQQVSKGETIALMGSSGNSTGPHVHFEIRGAKNPF